MIHRDFTTDIEITPRELANELWDMNSIEHTDFMLAMSQKYKNYF